MIDQAESGFLTRTRAGAFENDPLPQAQAAFLGEGLNRWLQLTGGEPPCVQSQRRTLAGNTIELFLVDIDRDHGSAERIGDLNGVTADAADTVDDHKISLADSGL